MLIVRSDGVLVRTFGECGVGPGQFSTPIGIATDEDGRVVVLDWGNHRAQIVDADGISLGAFGTPLYVHPVRRDE